jgi:hypothetical protein
MTRSEAIATIARKLATFDDERVRAVADIVEDMDVVPAAPLRPLSAREAGLLAQSKADFSAGRSYSMDEVIAHTDAVLGPFGVPPFKR